MRAKLDGVTLGILQARCSSTRLPGKVLKPILGVPMILRQLERVQRSTELDSVIVATSRDETDDELVNLLESNGVVVRRGSLNNVLSRFIQIADEFEPETIVRLTGDNPLADPHVIDVVIRSHKESRADYSSNSRIRTFPYGLDVECVSNAALQELLTFDLSESEKEHVTLGIYERPERFTVNSVVQETDNSELRWTVDYPGDFEFVEGVYAHLYPLKPDFDQNDVLQLLSQNPGMARKISDVPQ